MLELISTKAFKKFKDKEFKDALLLYEKLAELIGRKNFLYNINLCKENINKDIRSDAKFEKIMIFTNLGLGTIDGSSVFIANICRIFGCIFDEVHLVSVHPMGRNFEERVSGVNIKNIVVNNDDISLKIKELDAKNSYKNIFVRAFGDKSLWFDEEYCSKIIYYWPLVLNPSAEDREIYNKVEGLAFQTDELKEYTFNKFGQKKCMLIPPLIEKTKLLNKDKIERNGRVNISYVGTLRPECYSLELLSSIFNVLKIDNNVHFQLAIGKIFYKNYEDKLKILEILKLLRTHPNVSIEEKVSSSRCEEILVNSDFSFSLWQPTEENTRQISTKFLECLSAGVNVICIETPLYRKFLGSNYRFLIKNENELQHKIIEAVSIFRKKPERFFNDERLSFYNLEHHTRRFLEYIKKPNSSTNESNDEKLFDKIYGVYINQSELGKLKCLEHKFKIGIVPFKGVNGREELKESFEKYSIRELETDWEKRAKKKRLTIGAMGHLATFINIAKDAINNKYKKILIIEADALFLRDYNEEIKRNRPDNYKIWYLGAGKWNDNLSKIDDNFYVPNQTTGTFAIAFDTSVLNECIAVWEQYKEPTDVALWEITDKYKNYCYVQSRNLIICDVANSNTTNERSQKALSEKFGWNLESYDLSSVESVDRYVNDLEIEIDFYINDAFFEIKIKDNSSIRVNVNRSKYNIHICGEVEFIDYKNLFIRKMNFS